MSAPTLKSIVHMLFAWSPFFSPQIKLGWKDYLFSLLAQLADNLEQLSPCSSSAKKELPANVSNRLVPVSNMSVHSVSHASQSLRLPQAGHHVNAQVTRLPSFIPVPFPVADLALAHIPSPVFQMMVRSPVLWSDLPLQATTEKLIDCIPAAWKKVCF